ncbi:hypothetical protein TWF751_006953 [Orbilia oligospora]|nr:hypothetical protein TWF751_006953 [Orbilia oligospora]
MHRPLTREAYSIGWICAIQIELAAALAVLDEVLPESPFDMIQGDPNLYYFARIQNHDIVITCLPAGIIGIASATMVANNMMRSFPGVRRGFGLMVGVGGGAPNLRDGHDIRLGDVVISQPNGPHPSVVQYDFGKAIERGQFIQTGQLNSPPRVLLCSLSALKARDPADFGRTIREQAQQIGAEDQRFQRPQSPDYLFKADHFHIPDESLEDSATCSRCDLTKVVVRPERNANYPHFHYGTIASANQVMKDGVKRDTITIDPEDAFGRDNVARVVKWLAADSPQEEYDTRISNTVDDLCYLVVDGYDETFNDIAPRRYQVRGAREVFSRKVVERMEGTRARLLITSRDGVDIRRSPLEFNDRVPILTTTIEIRPGDTLGDLYKFCGSIVDERLKSSKLDDNDKEVIADRLAQKSDGMFIWARLNGTRLFPGKDPHRLLLDL